MPGNADTVGLLVLVSILQKRAFDWTTLIANVEIQERNSKSFDVVFSLGHEGTIYIHEEKRTERTEKGVDRFHMLLTSFLIVYEVLRMLDAFDYDNQTKNLLNDFREEALKDIKEWLRRTEGGSLT